MCKHCHFCAKALAVQCCFITARITICSIFHTLSNHIKSTVNSLGKLYDWFFFKPLKNIWRYLFVVNCSERRWWSCSSIYYRYIETLLENISLMSEFLPKKYTNRVKFGEEGDKTYCKRNFLIEPLIDELTIPAN